LQQGQDALRGDHEEPCQHIRGRECGSLFFPHGFIAYCG
jgi:hypothetical protein